ncbi:MAG: hypothetical protein HN796_14155 [Gemmatimonadetes bacterium]|nr:hypothetical protein [Gemmatimonadota bacterium]MBT7455031.1 hypothetical protein [Gemmatimonadota bacterium]
MCKEPHPASLVARHAGGDIRAAHTPYQILKDTETEGLASPLALAG